MANLVYSAIASADGYVEDEQGKFDWGALDEEVHTTSGASAVNETGRKPQIGSQPC